MKRGGPLQRRTPLQAKTPINRGESRLARTPIRRQSKKRQAENRERVQVLKAKYGLAPVRCEVPGCVREANDAHEVLTRARGGSITDPDNIRAVCRPHHDEIGAEAPWAYELGFLVHSWEVAS